MIGKTPLRVWVIALCVLLAAVWWWTRVPDRNAGVVDTRGNATRVEPAPVDVPVREQPSSAPASVQASEAPVREAAPRAASVLLVAIEKATRTPIVDADVWFGSQTMLREHRPRHSSDEEDLLRRFGEHVRTDERGEVWVPAEVHGAAVARKGELAGLVQYAPGTGQRVEIELDRQRSITVQVVDTAGVPVAGVAVRIEARDPNTPLHAGHEIWTGETRGEEGLAVLHQFDEARIWRGAGGAFVDHALGKWIVATLPFPLATPVEVGFNPDELPTEPVRLVLPPTGSMRIEILQPDGTPHPGADWVYAFVPSPPPQHWHSVARWIVRGGSLDVPHIGLGLELRIATHPTGYEPTAVELAGPTVAGQTVHAVLRLERVEFEVRGRALDSGGTPLDTRALSIQLEVENGAFGRMQIAADTRTESDGNFVGQPRNLQEGAIVHELRLQTDPHASGEVLWAEVSLEARAVSLGALDLGDVSMLPAPIAVSGRVVDAAGEPIYWAMIDTFHDVENPPHITPGTQRHYDNDFRAYSRLDGTFDIYGELGANDWRIQVTKSPYVPSDPISVRDGDRGIEVVLRGTGAIEGKVLVDDGVSPRSLEIEVHREGGARRERWREGTYRPVDDGSFHIGELETGVVDLYFHLDVENGPVHELRGVLVETGGASSEPRLTEIDLRGRVHAFDFEVLDSDGATVTNAWLEFSPAGEDGGASRRVVFADGAGTFDSAWRRIDVEVRAHGFRPRRLEGVMAGSRVRLERGIPLVVRLPAEFEEPPAPLTLRLAVIPQAIYHGESQNYYAGDNHNWRMRWDRELSGVFDADGVLELWLPQTGVYEFEWHLKAGNRPSGISPSRDAWKFEVTDPSTPLELNLAPDPESYRATVKQLTAAAGG